MRVPAGPGDAGRRPFDASPRLQLVPAGVHHTNTETERPKSILPRRCVVCSGRYLERACCRRSPGQRCRVGSEPGQLVRGRPPDVAGPSTPSFVSPPPIHTLRDLTTAGALAEESPRKIPQDAGDHVDQHGLGAADQESGRRSWRRSPLMPLCARSTLGMEATDTWSVWSSWILGWMACGEHRRCVGGV